MFIAKNAHNEIIEIEEATKGNDYYCPECKGKLRVRDGEINVKHFSHESNCDCDNWGEMSEWHLEWQRKFDKSVREIVLQKDGKKHRADVHMSVKGINLTIEFQKSSINKPTIRERVEFYSQFGNMIWLFDLSDKNITLEKEYNKLHRFNWLYPSKSILTPLEFAELNTIVCFQLKDDQIAIPCGVEDNNWKEFYCRKNDLIHKDEFTQMIKEDYFLKPFNRIKFNKEFLTPHEYYLRRKVETFLTYAQKNMIANGTINKEEIISIIQNL